MNYDKRQIVIDAEEKVSYAVQEKTQMNSAPAWDKIKHPSAGALPVALFIIGLIFGLIGFFSNALWAGPCATIFAVFCVGAPVVASLRRIESYMHKKG